MWSPPKDFGSREWYERLTRFLKRTSLAATPQDCKDRIGQRTRMIEDRAMSEAVAPYDRELAILLRELANAEDRVFTYVDKKYGAAEAFLEAGGTCPRYERLVIHDQEHECLQDLFRCERCDRT